MKRDIGLWGGSNAYICLVCDAYAPNLKAWMYHTTKHGYIHKSYDNDGIVMGGFLRRVIR